MKAFQNCNQSPMTATRLLVVSLLSSLLPPQDKPNPPNPTLEPVT